MTLNAFQHTFGIKTHFAVFRAFKRYSHELEKETQEQLQGE